MVALNGQSTVINTSYKLTFPNPSSSNVSTFSRLFEEGNGANTTTNEFENERYDRHIDISQEYSRPEHYVIRIVFSDHSNSDYYSPIVYAAVPPSIKSCGKTYKSVENRYDNYKTIKSRYVSKNKFTKEQLEKLQEIASGKNSGSELNSPAESYKYSREYYARWRESMLNRFFSDAYIVNGIKKSMRNLGIANGSINNNQRKMIIKKLVENEDMQHLILKRNNNKLPVKTERRIMGLIGSNVPAAVNINANVNNISFISNNYTNSNDNNSNNNNGRDRTNNNVINNGTARGNNGNVRNRNTVINRNTVMNRNN